MVFTLTRFIYSFAQLADLLYIKSVRQEDRKVDKQPVSNQTEEGRAFGRILIPFQQR